MSDEVDAGGESPARLRELPSRMLSMTAAHSARLVDAGLAEVDAHKWHYAVLAALAEFGPASQSGLSRRTGIYRSDLVAVLNALTERALVRRAPDPGDRRRNVITLTAEGRRQLRRLDRLIDGIQEELLAPLSQRERAQLVKLLGKLLAHHGGPHWE